MGYDIFGWYDHYYYHNEEEKPIGEILTGQGETIFYGSAHRLIELYALLREYTYRENEIFLFEGDSGKNIPVKIQYLYPSIYFETENCSLKILKRDLFRVLEEVESAVKQQKEDPRDIECIAYIEKDFLTFEVKELFIKEKLPILIEKKEAK